MMSKHWTLKNIIPSGGITCLVATKATEKEAVLWHRQLGHVQLQKYQPIERVNTATARQICKKIEERTVREPLELLHMDLFGPVSVESINKKNNYIILKVLAQNTPTDSNDDTPTDELVLSLQTLYDAEEGGLNTVYPLPSDTAYPTFCPIQLRMTKVIKGEFEKIKDVKVEDVSLTCDTPLEAFNNEVNRLSRMDDDLFTYEVEVANILCDSKIDDDSEHEADDDMGYDPSDIRGDNDVELTDEESSDDMDEVSEVFRIDTNLLTKDIKGFKTYEDYKDDWIYEWNKDVPWVDEKPWTNAGVWTKPTPVKHTCKPFNYKTGCSKWPTCSWMDDGYCNGGNLPGTYIIGNQLHYQDYEWYEALEDSELKDEALRNKAIMEGFIDDDDESRYEQMRRWNIYTNYDDAYEINHEDNEREELCEDHELPVCNIRRYMMIKYSFNNDEEYVAVKEDEYDDLTITKRGC
ncbi:hypothetical protein Tco_1410267 [Tanacetum coccineum]